MTSPSKSPQKEDTVTPGKIAVFAAPAVIGVTALWGFWPVSAPAAATGLFPYTDSVAVARGERLSREHCAACHGADLGGEPDWRAPDSEGFLPAPPHDQSGHTWHHPDEQLFMITKYGTEAMAGGDYNSRMAGFGTVLSDNDILAVLAFIKSTWPPVVIARHNRVNAAQQ